MRKLALFTTVFAFFLLASFASAQQADVAVGGSTLLSTASTNDSLSVFQIPEKGGFYPNVGFDVIFHHRIGVGYTVSWKGGQGAYGGPGGQPFRPILQNVDAVFQPRLSKKFGADLAAGIGWQSTRFYGFTDTSNCVNFGACYTSANHFLVHVGGGVRYYVWNHVFVRPELNFYKINNNAEFSSGNLLRVGASIGYTIGGPE